MLPSTFIQFDFPLQEKKGLKMEALEALNVLNSCGKKYTNFGKLPIGEYPVEKFSFVSTQQGERIRVDLEDYFVFLPQRYFDNVCAERCAVLNKHNYIMVFGGKENTKAERIILSFRLAAPSDDVSK